MTKSLLLIIWSFSTGKKSKNIKHEFGKFRKFEALFFFFFFRITILTEKFSALPHKKKNHWVYFSILQKKKKLQFLHLLLQLQFFQYKWKTLIRNNIDTKDRHLSYLLPLPLTTLRFHPFKSSLFFQLLFVHVVEPNDDIQHKANESKIYKKKKRCERIFSERKNCEKKKINFFSDVIFLFIIC